MKVDQWKTEIDAVTHGFINQFSSLIEDEFNWKPHTKVWSVAQNIDHVMVINASYYPVIKHIREGKNRLPVHAGWNWLVRWFGNMILKSVAPDRKRKMKTFPIWEPAQSQLPVTLLTDFKHHQQELKQLIDSCADLIAAGIVISSPANRSIVYTLETAFDIIVTHEKRHWQQAIEIDSLRRSTQV